jgi:hypothetical protein
MISESQARTEMRRDFGFIPQSSRISIEAVDPCVAEASHSE